MIQNKNNLLIASLWIYTLLLYLFRSIFAPLHYLAYVSFGILVIVYTFYSIKHWQEIKIKYFLYFNKEYLILSLFIVWGIITTAGIAIAPLKELFNFVAVFFLAFVLFHKYKYIDWSKILKLWILFSAIIGSIAIVVWLNLILSLNFEVLKVISTYKISLTSIALTTDYNFYCLFFILSIIILYYALYIGVLKQKFFFSQTLLWIFILNIVLSNSRRGIFVLLLFILIGFIYGLISKNKLKKNNQLYKNIIFNYITFLLVFSMLIILIPFRASLIKEKKTMDKITLPLYRYSTIFNSNLSYSIFKEKLWPNNWYSYKDIAAPENLFYNGDFSQGLIFWQPIMLLTDTVTHSLIKTEFGNALRVHRNNGNGDWPMAYRGRSIVYYKDITYTFKFKFREIKGQNAPFNIGWWIKEDGDFLYNLQKDITKIENGWYECICSYTFTKTHQGASFTFMNSQKANTTIDFADIQLFSNDTLNRPKYIDQIQTSEVNDSINYLSDNRTERWQYAFELFKNYTLKEKIIGNGFNYIYLFDQKFFHPKLTIEEIKSKDYFDYPHNPILSAFLYSGIIGGLFNIYFVLLTIWYYWKSRRTLGLFLILYGITLFFVFFSGNTFFSVPIFIVLSMIPFIERYRIKTSS